MRGKRRASCNKQPTLAEGQPYVWKADQLGLYFEKDRVSSPSLERSAKQRPRRACERDRRARVRCSVGPGGVVLEAGMLAAAFESSSASTGNDFGSGFHGRRFAA